MSAQPPSAISDLIAAHSTMLARLAGAPIESEPAAFVCQLGELVDEFATGPVDADVADILRAAATCLAEALDRRDGSLAQAEFLQAANCHLRDLATHVLSAKGGDPHV